MCLCEFMCTCIWRCCRGQKRVPEPLEAALYLTESCSVWALGTRLWLSGRGASALNCWDISPALVRFTFYAVDSGIYYFGHHPQHWGHNREDSAAQVFSTGLFQGAYVLPANLLSSYPLWIWNVNTLDFSVSDSRQSTVLLRHNQTF